MCTGMRSAVFQSSVSLLASVSFSSSSWWWSPSRNRRRYPCHFITITDVCTCRSDRQKERTKVLVVHKSFLEYFSQPKFSTCMNYLILHFLQALRNSSKPSRLFGWNPRKPRKVRHQIVHFSWTLDRNVLPYRCL